MPAKKTPKPTAKAATKATPVAKAVKPQAAAAEAEQPEAAKAAAAPKAPVKGKPQIPGKPEPSWAKFNQGGGHAQKMSKGRPFRHQGR